MRTSRRRVGLTRIDLIAFVVLVLAGAAAWALVRGSTELIAPIRPRISDSARPVIGVSVRAAPQGGLRIVRVVSPAREAGLRPGDRVVAVDDRILTRPEELADLVQSAPEEHVFHVEARRPQENGLEGGVLVTLRAERRRVSPADEGLAFEDVTFKNREGLQLRGWLIPAAARPDGKRSPVVAYGHGNGTDRRHWLPLAARVHDAGIAQLLFDFAGRGESDGEVITLGAHEAGDLRAALDFLGARPELDGDRAALAGRSMGASAAIYAAAEDPRVRVVVLDSPFADLGSIVDERLRAMHVPPAIGRFPLFLLAGWRAGFDPARLRPVDAIAKVRVPILLLHGDRDALVPFSNAERLKKAAGGPVTFIPLEGQGHNGPRSDEIGDRIAMLLARVLEP